MREYDDQLDVMLKAEHPVGFTWRQRSYQVAAVVDQWRERTNWWQLNQTLSDQPPELERSVWRVEASLRGHQTKGVYDLVQARRGWSLVRAFD